METNPEWLQLSLAGTNFHGPKPFQATEVLLYLNSEGRAPKASENENGRIGLIESFLYNGNVMLKPAKPTSHTGED